MSSAATLDHTLGALANEHRRSIVDRLAAGPITSPTLGRDYAMSKQALNKHVAVLEAAGLIERRRLGRVDELHLRPEPLDQVAAWATQIRRGWESSCDRLEQLLREDDR